MFPLFPLADQFPFLPKWDVTGRIGIRVGCAWKSWEMAALWVGCAAEDQVSSWQGMQKACCSKTGHGLTCVGEMQCLYEGTVLVEPVYPSEVQFWRLTIAALPSSAKGFGVTVGMGWERMGWGAMSVDSARGKS